MQIWLHLQTVVENRRRGARKATATRQAKKALKASHIVEGSPKDGNECFCGDCGHTYQEETDEPEVWIECSMCEPWFHAKCEKLTCLPQPEDNDNFIITTNIIINTGTSDPTERQYATHCCNTYTFLNFSYNFPDCGYTWATTREPLSDLIINKDAA